MTDTSVAPVQGQGATPVTPSADPVPISSAPAAGTAPAPQSGDWVSGLNPDVLGYVQNKGWKAPSDVVDGYRNLEKHLGVPADKLLKLPDFDKADKVELDQFYGKLGRPMDASKYDIKVPDGQSPDFANFAKNMFYEAGLSQKQASVIEKYWNEYTQQTIEGVNAQGAARLEQETVALRQEWGQAYDQEMEVAKHAARSLGISHEKLDQIESVLGYSETIKFMNQIGKRLGEDKFVSTGSNNGALTPSAAKEKIKALQSDKEFVAKYLAGNMEAKAEMERLHKMVAG